jgi:putative transposase
LALDPVQALDQRVLVLAVAVDGGCGLGHLGAPSRNRRPGRPPISHDVAQLNALARENPNLGYLRIVCELRKLSVAVSATSVRNILTNAGMPPAPHRDSQSWRSFLRVPHQQREHDVDAAAGCNLLMHLDDHDREVQFLIHDRDAKYPVAFDALLATEHIKVIRTPVHQDARAGEREGPHGAVGRHGGC